MEAVDLEPPDLATAIATVVADADVWAHVLGFLSLPDATVACSTCRAHRSLLNAAKQQIKLVKLHTRWLSHKKSFLGATPRPVMEIFETPSQWVEPRGFHSILRVRRRTGRHFSGPTTANEWHNPNVLEVVTKLDGLQSLWIDLTPSPQFAPSSVRHAFATLKDMIHLFDCRDDDEHAASSSSLFINSSRREIVLGCQPRFVFPRARVTELRLTATEAEARKQVTPVSELFLVRFAISYGRHLSYLDLTGAGPTLAPSLLLCELPVLKALRVGEPTNIDHTHNHEHKWDHYYYYEGASTYTVMGMPIVNRQLRALPALATHLPTLECLDLGFGNFGGIDYADLHALCTTCPHIKHLDLSQVMTYMNFGPAFDLFCQHAPQLESLALHGLHLPSDSLIEFGKTCKGLQAVDLVGCKYEVSGLVRFLTEAKSLTHLDLSLTVVPQKEILRWLEGRQRARPEVPALHSLSLVQSGVLLEDDSDEHAFVMQTSLSWNADYEARVHDLTALVKGAVHPHDIRIEASNRFGTGGEEKGHGVDWDMRTRIVERMWQWNSL